MSKHEELNHLMTKAFNKVDAMMDDRNNLDSRLLELKRMIVDMKYFMTTVEVRDVRVSADNFLNEDDFSNNPLIYGGDQRYTECEW